ncbi:hypothetical protein TAMA11512_19070 [Selenomonas sp. TAMA-11512]|nr:hypothetical protein TAMA11512_19070 [Selenomonas sp. TAMA-11512]
MGCHGVLSEEKENRQPFVVDLVMMLDLRRAGRTDDLSSTVSYADVYARIRRMVEEERFALIEALAEAIADDLLRTYPLEGVRVTVHKPAAPMGGPFDDVAVTIERRSEPGEA